MNEERVPVLIVGGSLVGLSAAIFLGGHGVAATLVERNTGPSPHPRARGVNARTMELFRGAGVEGRLRGTESARDLAGNSGILAAESLAGKEMGALQEGYHRDTGAQGEDGGWPGATGWCLCHQHEVEPVLRERAAELGARLLFGTELVEFTQDDEGVTALVRDADGTERRIRADYLVAADGAGSEIRRRLGIEQDGLGTLGHFMNIQFEADLVEPLRGRRFVMCYTISKGQRSGLLPVNNADRWLLHVPYDPRTAPEFTPQRCVELVRTAAGVDDLEVAIKGTASWESAGRVARSFARGRVFLVGDAAHVMPPTGAFGSNTGIQDAHNLAWKLAAVLHGRAGAGLLETYDAERRPVAAATVEQAVLRSKDRPRLAGGPQPPPDPRIQPDQVVTFGARYRSAAVGPDEPAGRDAGWDGEPWEPEQSGRPGTRAPHLQVKRDGELISTLDLYGRGFVLVAGPDGGPWADAAVEAAAGAGIECAVHRAGGDLAEASGDLCAVYGLDRTGAVLVRPDGYVAWRSEGAPEGDPREHLAGIFAGLLCRSGGRAAVSGS